MPFRYDEESHRYFDESAGRYVAERRVHALVGRVQTQREARVRALVERMRDGELSLQGWVRAMREEIRDVYVVSYLAGRGGRSRMDQSDWGRIGGLLRGQYAYLNRFATDVASGNLSVDQIAARANLYLHSSTNAYERAKTHAHDMPELPAYPGDGSSLCGANDRCRWSIQTFEDRWEATWTLGYAEHCQTCVDRSFMWAPLVIER